MVRRFLFAVAISAAALLVPVSSLADAPTPRFWVSTYNQGPGAPTEVDLEVDLLASDPPPAMITFTVPGGYSAALLEVVGAKIGDAEIDLTPSGGSGPPTKLLGAATVADPAAFAGDPRAQACAPGTHLAVWSIDFGAAGRIPVAVDAVQYFYSYRITACLGALQRPGFVPTSVDINLENVFQNPKVPSTYWWTALVTPTDPSGAPVAVKAYELQGGEPIPETLTLHAMWNPKTHLLTVTGTARGGGQPRSEVGVHLYGGAYGDATVMRQIGIAPTNDSGSYSFKAKLRQKPRWMYGSVWDYFGSRCPVQPRAPAGCPSWTIDGTYSQIVAVR